VAMTPHCLPYVQMAQSLINISYGHESGHCCSNKVTAPLLRAQLVRAGVWLVQSRHCIGLFLVVCGAQCDMLGAVLLCVAVIVSVGVGSVAADSSGESRVQVVVFRDITPCRLVNSCR